MSVGNLLVGLFLDLRGLARGSKVAPFDGEQDLVAARIRMLDLLGQPRAD